MTSLIVEQAHHHLTKLKLLTIDAILDATIERAMSNQLTPLETVAYLVEQEWKQKTSATVSSRMKHAGFPVIKRIDDFDFQFQPSIDQTVLRDLKGLRSRKIGRAHV